MTNTMKLLPSTVQIFREFGSSWKRLLLKSNYTNGWSNSCCFSSSASISKGEQCVQAISNTDGNSPAVPVPGSAEKYLEMSSSLAKSDTWKSKFLSTMLIYPNFVSLEEESEILKEIEPYISRLHYESSHWDDAIHNYRETERGKWNQRNTRVLNRVRSLCFPPGVPQLCYVHVLDLEKKGVIKPHIDSVRFCGNTIAGLSLLSDSIMRLRHDVEKDFYCDVLLPRLSLYVMSDFARYEFTHEILGEKESHFKNNLVPRDRRISVICRNEPDTPTSNEPALNLRTY